MVNRGNSQGDSLKFLVHHESRLRSLAGSIRVVFSGRVPKIGWSRFFDPHPMQLTRPQRPRTIFTSALLHFAFFFFLVSVPWAVLFPQHSHSILPVITADYQLIYPLPPRKVEIHSQPKSASKGEHKAAKASPSTGEKLAAGAGVKTPTPVPKFTLVLKPPHPDNNNQTVIQAGTPPDLRIKQNVPLPNVLLAGLTSKNDLKVPTTGAAPKAVRDPATGAPAMNVPAPVIPDMALAVQVPTEKPPLLASPEVALPLPAQEQALGSIFATQRNGSASQTTRGLLVLGANPSPPTDMMSVPEGNRYGQFSVDLLGGKTGVPSGPGGPTMGGGGTSAAGSANAKGSGSGSAAAAVSGDVGSSGNGASAVAAFGPSSNGSGNEQGILPPWMIANLVYPVNRAMKLPAINLIVTAGPIGGGGLGMFGVLSCPNIYTIYLPMPGKPWVLQYCQHQAAPAAAPPPNGAEVHFGPGITPPWAVDKYDFHRPPIAAYKRDHMIVLKGIIATDGTVKNLKVYQGVGSIADQAALAAFNKWKFHPATDAKGKPIMVDMLVGIPATVSETQ
jgi:Gram-negative bacterial TonB protein C-terminal